MSVWDQGITGHNVNVCVIDDGESNWHVTPCIGPVKSWSFNIMCWSCDIICWSCDIMCWSCDICIGHVMSLRPERWDELSPAVSYSCAVQEWIRGTRILLLIL